jgi:MFS family permease
LDINEKRKRIDYSTLRKPIFTFLSICNFLQGLVFYLPGIFLPCLSLPTQTPIIYANTGTAYATSLNLTATQSSILLALLNLTSVLGTLIFGYLSDIVDIHILLSISCLGSCLAVFTLWGMARTFLPLLLFSMIFGFLGGSFESLFPRFATAMTSDPDAEITFYGFFEFERGLGMVLAGPISSVLVQRFKDSGAGLGSYGGGVYVGIVVFTGITLGVSAFAGVGWFFRARRWYK